MAEPGDFHEPRGHPAIRWGLIALALALVLAFAWYLYVAMNGSHGVKMEQAPMQTFDMLPPPPPPPPPPEQPKEKPPEPTEKPTDTPTPSPEPKQDNAPAPMTQNAPAQSGSDSYGLAAGNGGGMGSPGGKGTCIGTNCGSGPAGGVSDAFYTRSLSSALQRRVQADKRVNRDVFKADFAIWIDASGAVTRAELVKGSDDSKRDTLLRTLLLSVTGLTPPPPSFKFPQRISVSGKKAI